MERGGAKVVSNSVESCRQEEHRYRPINGDSRGEVLGPSNDTTNLILNKILRLEVILI
jgi:hypothetical protein